MGQSLRITTDNAREVVAASCIQLVRVAGSCKWFPGLAKKLSSNKPAPVVAHLTGEAERTCYEWVRGKFDPPSRTIIKLLHTEAGWLVLEYLMHDCKQSWWLETVRARRCAAAYDREAQTELNL
jgi:hypothetical protein